MKNFHLISQRHPFPGPGLGVRITGEVSLSQLGICREADKIFIEAIIAAGLYLKISQAFAALLGGVKAVGVEGDQRSYGQCIVLRAVTTTDYVYFGAAPPSWALQLIAKQDDSKILQILVGFHRKCVHEDN